MLPLTHRGPDEGRLSLRICNESVGAGDRAMLAAIGHAYMEVIDAVGDTYVHFDEDHFDRVDASGYPPDIAACILSWQAAISTWRTEKEEGLPW